MTLLLTIQTVLVFMLVVLILESLANMRYYERETWPMWSAAVTAAVLFSTFYIGGV